MLSRPTLKRPPIDPKARGVEWAGFGMAFRADLAPRVGVGDAQRVGERIVLPHCVERARQAIGGNVHVPVGDGSDRDVQLSASFFARIFTLPVV